MFDEHHQVRSCFDRVRGDMRESAARMQSLKRQIAVHFAGIASARGHLPLVEEFGKVAQDPLPNAQSSLLVVESRMTRIAIILVQVYLRANATAVRDLTGGFHSRMFKVIKRHSATLFQEFLSVIRHLDGRLVDLASSPQSKHHLIAWSWRCTNSILTRRIA